MTLAIGRTGRVAQLGERLVRNEEAGGSNPLSSTIFQNDFERAKQSYRGTLGLSSLSDSFRYLVIHPERHCLSAISSVNTSRLPITNRGKLGTQITWR